jgi:hypothetical protein
MGRKTDEKLELLLPTHLVAHLYFFATRSPTLKKSKRATKPTHQDTANIDRHSDRRESTTGNSTYKKLAVRWLNEALCFVSSSVLADSFRLRNRQLLVASKRCKQWHRHSTQLITLKNKSKNL